MVATEHTTVARLRLRASPLTSAAAPARVAALLARADLSPRRLAPGAVLCVRRLADPAPGTLRTDGASPRLPEHWRERVVASLDEALARAARPALAAVPAGAESVLFADRAELLATLARDWCDGTALTHWWWRSLTSGGPPSRAVPRVWLESVEAVPAALELLSRERVATAFAQRLDDEHATSIALALAERYGLRDVVAALSVPGRFGRADETPPLVAGDRSVTGAGRPARTAPAPMRRVSAAARAPAWVGLVPESAEPALVPAQRAMLALGLVLRREPSLARDPRFAATLVRWASAPAGAGDRSRPEKRVAARPPAPAMGGGDPLDPGPEPALPTARAAGQAPARHALRVEWDAAPPGIEGARPVESEARAVPVQMRAQMPAIDAHESPALAVRGAYAPPVPAGEESAALRTSLGGMPMLVNAAIALELYGDFSSPLHPGLRLDPWQFVSLAGRRLLGPRRARRYHDDPLWGLLEQLAGNRGPGAGFRPPSTWRLPPAWLEAFAQDERPWTVSRSHGRLRIFHPAGFPVVDVPASAHAALQLGRALARYGAPAVVSRGPARGPQQEPLERWLGWLVPYLRARLRLALGADPAERLLPIPATVRWGADRLDVDISLSQLPLEVRIAGLDRDPGWFPAGGRTIAFHFA